MCAATCHYRQYIGTIETKAYDIFVTNTLLAHDAVAGIYNSITPSGRERMP